MKYLLSFLALTLSLHAEENPYKVINTRNAFSLIKDFTPPPILTVKTNFSPVELNLTGIMKYKGVTNVFLYSKDLPERFLTLNYKKPASNGIQLLSVKKNLVKVNNNGITETLSFAVNKIPNIIGPAPVFNRPVMIKKDRENDKSKNKEKKIINPSPRPSIVKVPSRRPKIDPKIIEKSLEYIGRIEDQEKKEYVLKRLEKLQSGQEILDRKIDTNEKRRQYDERRREK
jgi:hypothetical protein